ncbi:MAG: hypothetical protein AAF791_05420 [Bacteroidota bacterium]
MIDPKPQTTDPGLVRLGGDITPVTEAGLHDSASVLAYPVPRTSYPTP